MKKKMIIVLVLCTLVGGCSSKKESDVKEVETAEEITEAPEETNLDSISELEPIGEVFEIKDKMFLGQVNEMYYNPDGYLGKTIEYEGISYSEEYEGKEYHFVIRYGPGCCANDAYVGFEVRAEDGVYPDDDSWVHVSGVFSMEKIGENTYYYLANPTIEVLEERGQETVLQ